MLSRAPVESCKLFLVGDGGVGKTALRRSLKESRSRNHPLEHEDAPEEASTRTLGVEYDIVNLRENGSVGLGWREQLTSMLSGQTPQDMFPMTVQDHGGQRGFHLVHDMFFQSSYAVYAIVIRIDKVGVVEVEHQLRYWLQFLVSAGNSNGMICLCWLNWLHSFTLCAWLQVVR